MNEIELVEVAPVGLGELEQLVQREEDGNEVAKAAAAGSKSWLGILALATAASFVTNALISSIAPFFPEYAKSTLGMSDTMVGVTISMFPLFSLVWSPAAGTACRLMGRQLTLFSGLVLMAFGTLSLGLSSSTGMCLISRAIQGIGAANCNIASSAMLMKNAKNLTTALACVETACGLGYLVAPMLAGAIFQATSGGFMATFAVLSTLPASLALALPFLLRAGQQEQQRANDEHQGHLLETGVDESSASGVSTRRMMKIGIRVLGNRTVAICCTSIFMYSVCTSFLDPVFEKHLELSLEATPIAIGFLFSLPAISYVVGCYVSVALTHCVGYKHTMSMGMIGLGFSFMFLGPAPSLAFLFVSRWVTWTIFVVADLLFGFAIALIFIPSMPCIRESLYEEKLEEDDENAMFDLVSTVFNSCNSFGDVCGPIFGAAAVATFWQTDEVACVTKEVGDCASGFQWASFLYAIVLVSVGCIIELFLPNRKVGTSAGRPERSSKKAPPC
jgi:MFS family permease